MGVDSLQLQMCMNPCSISFRNTAFYMMSMLDAADMLAAAVQVPGAQVIVNRIHRNRKWC